MNEPNLPIPTTHPREPVSNSTGEGAQTALAAMIRKRKMAENNVDEDPVDSQPAPLPVP